MKRAILLVVLLGLPGRKCEAQTKVDLSSQSKSVDFSTAAFTLPVRTGPSLSVSCRVGELFYKTNAPAGQNLYGCTSTNVWSLQSGGSGGGSGGGGAVSSVAGKVGDVSLQYTDLTDFKVQLSGGTAVIGAGCSASLPCTVRFGSKSYLFPNPATISNLTGTGTAGPHTVYIFVRADGILYFGINGVAVTGAALAGAVLVGEALAGGTLALGFDFGAVFAGTAFFWVLTAAALAGTALVGFGAGFLAAFASADFAIGFALVPDFDFGAAIEKHLLNCTEG